MLTSLTHHTRRSTAAPAPPRPLPPGYALALAAALLGATLHGLLVEGAYRVSPGVRPDLAAVLRGQDVLTLLTVPVLLVAAGRARSGSLRMHLLSLGLYLYYAYTYLMYAFAPFTDVFLLYTLIITLATFALVDGWFRLDMRAVGAATDDVPRTALAVFLVVVVAVFTTLWLSMILPAIPGGLPEGRVVHNVASAVHVLDLSFVLPLIAVDAWMLLRRSPAGPALAIVLLCKMLTLGLAMLAMNLFVETPAVAEMGLWSLIAVVSVGFLTTALRRTTAVPAPWMRRTIWC